LNLQEFRMRALPRGVTTGSSESRQYLRMEEKNIRDNSRDSLFEAVAIFGNRLLRA